jgi:hypothetical protein
LPRMQRRWATAWLALGLVACAETSDPVEEAREEWPLLGCDPLVPSYCAAPFPSNVFTVEDSSTPTGRRLQLDQALLPIDAAGLRALPDPWNELDGFSPHLAISAHFPGLTQPDLDASNVATAVTIERSLDEDSPTVLLDVTTGERVPHWVDLDATGTNDEQRMFMIRPAIRLDDATRYIVAIRGLEGVDVTDTFAALRDRTESEEPSVESRRALYGDIFSHLSTANVAREDLQLAWDFTTTSRENNTGWMVHMRDEAFMRIGGGGPTYTVASVEEDWDGDPEDHIAYKIVVDMEVPMYLDRPDPLATLIMGADGQPDPNPSMPTAMFEVEILIPQSATMAPAALLQYGHGLLGEKEQIESSHFLEFIDQYNYVLFCVDFIGFAADDEVHVGALLGNGQFHDFKKVIDRQLQGMLNSLFAMRMMKTTFAADPDYGQYIDPANGYYWGISQGGIYGGTYMSVSTDVTRGVLEVPGMPYNVLLSRSVDFTPFFDIIKVSYPDSRDHMLMLNYAQMLWDRIEPTGYLPYIRENMLPNTPSHEVLIRAALGDHQVTTYGAHIMARTLGIPHVDHGLREIWGLETVPGPVTGSAYTEYGFGLPDDPVQNIPQDQCEDPHGKLRSLDPARMEVDQFLREGVVANHCASGVCDFPDMSGCL